MSNKDLSHEVIRKSKGRYITKEKKEKKKIFKSKGKYDKGKTIKGEKVK